MRMNKIFPGINKHKYDLPRGSFDHKKSRKQITVLHPPWLSGGSKGANTT